ncbi:21108_t:CDS:2 [Rhizophagus irregularis]|nr:21108_t:CDS:2 [Rhizophagus irregularis]
MFIILYVSGLPTMWALMRQKPHDEIEEIMSKSSGDHEIYLTRIGPFKQISFVSPECVKDLLMAPEEDVPKFEFFYSNDENLSGPINIFTLFQRITIEILGKMAFSHQFGCLKSPEIPHYINVNKHNISFIGTPLRMIFSFINEINELPLESNKKFFKAINNKENSTDLLTKMLEYATSIALATSFYYLAKYPEMQERTRSEVINILGNNLTIPTSEQLKEMNYVNAIIKESLRIHPPTTLTNFRKPSKPIKIGSYVVPKGVLCIMNIWQIHHNFKYWENPNQYKS